MGSGGEGGGVFVVNDSARVDVRVYSSSADCLQKSRKIGQEIRIGMENNRNWGTVATVARWNVESKPERGK